jgi:hypothetical protein
MKREQATRDRFITGRIAWGRRSFDVSPSTPVHLHAVPEVAAAKKESGVISTPTSPTPHRIASNRIGILFFQAVSFVCLPAFPLFVPSHAHLFFVCCLGDCCPRL